MSHCFENKLNSFGFTAGSEHISFFYRHFLDKYLTTYEIYRYSAKFKEVLNIHQHLIMIIFCQLKFGEKSKYRFVQSTEGKILDKYIILLLSA